MVLTLELALIGMVHGARPGTKSSLLNGAQLFDTTITTSSLAFLIMKLGCGESKALKIMFQLIRSKPHPQPRTHTRTHAHARARTHAHTHK